MLATVAVPNGDYDSSGEGTYTCRVASSLATLKVQDRCSSVRGDRSHLLLSEFVQCSIVVVV